MNKRQPMRTCVGCRRVRPSSDMNRYRLADGVVMFAANVDSGRGAWLCLDQTCVELALKREAFSRAFRQKVARAELSWLESDERPLDA